ncbi:DUF3472 domain-containing protein [Maribacter sp. MMG018]|uniref:DUF3472 domain-containing protein n=1 Tax=Maribacter sp. MMG018 TaxID=2822688 RepID=UPI001B38EBDF|nr:DUF3472 domain-containing protein [Maribacter sp. MMG018]MBQ4914581.1 DUF3472 domain-containing protein [Maribacter sp. MMG018]
MKVLFIVMIIGLFGCDPDVVVYNPEPASTEEPAEGPLDFSVIIPPGGNSWVVNNVAQNSTVIYDSGIHNWIELDDVIRTYFKVSSAGTLNVGLNISAPEGTSKIRVTVGDQTVEKEITNTDYADVEIGQFDLESAGYHYIEIQGLEKAATYIGDINNVLLGGSAVTNGVAFVENEEDFYFGRRGPSVHLKYTTPDSDITWFYNEVTVPEGEDVVGSYFMANGFGEGYFGMQVNSDSERRILFSVWSPYVTDNPEEIPEDQRITLLGNGEGVTVGEFGAEGSGGQSYMTYQWQPETTYKFLLKGEPSGSNSTDYTAYFYAPELGEWHLIASFRRPQTSTYLTNFHSFLENFDTKTGYITRKGTYGNQWVRDTAGNWHEVTEATFTYDATANAGIRQDYQGGIDNNTFYLKNCGFFNENTTYGSVFSRTGTGNVPNIDFGALPEVTVPEEEEVDFYDKSAWEVLEFSSQEEVGEGDNGFAALIIDGDSDTYWHSCWNNCSETFGYPHTLVIDMKASNTADRIQVIQRNGSRKVKTLGIAVSSDGVTWEDLGDFILENSANAQVLSLSEPVAFRYLKLTALDAFDGDRFAALAEVSVGMAQ